MAKVGDKHNCPLCGTNTVVEGSPDVLLDGMPVARVGDKTACGASIVTGLSWLKADEIPVAIVGSVTSHGGIIEGSSTAKTGAPGGGGISPSDYNRVAYNGVTHAFERDPNRPELDGNEGLGYFAEFDHRRRGYLAGVKSGTLPPLSDTLQQKSDTPKNWVKLHLVDQNDKPIPGESYIVRDATNANILDTGYLNEQGRQFVPLPEHVKEVFIEYPEIEPYDEYDNNLMRRPGEGDVSYAQRIQAYGNQALKTEDPKTRIMLLEQIHSALLVDQGVSSPINLSSPTQGDIRWLTYTQGLKPQAWGYPGIPILRRNETLPEKDMGGENWAVMYGGGTSGLFVGPDSHFYDRGEAVRQGLRRDRNDNSPQLNQLAYVKKLIAQYGPEVAMQEARTSGSIIGMAAEMGMTGLGNKAVIRGAKGIANKIGGKGKGPEQPSPQGTKTTNKTPEEKKENTQQQEIKKAANEGRNSYTPLGMGTKDSSKKEVRLKTFSYKNNPDYEYRPTDRNPERSRYHRVNQKPKNQNKNPGDSKHKNKNSGENEPAAFGREVHKKRAEERRASGLYDSVEQPIKDKITNEPIRVPEKVNLETGKPATSKMQTAKPDAVSYKHGVIIDTKPMGRPAMKDRQEIIRFIKAYEIREGKLPKRIVIEWYDPKTGEPVKSESFSPYKFLPKSDQ